MKALQDFELQLDPVLGAAGVTVGFLLLGGLDNRLSDLDFALTREHLLREIVDTVTLAELERDPYLVGYRELHRYFGIDDAALVPSPESLLRLLLKHGKLRSINPIVDVYGYVALKHRLSCGAHDLDQLAGGIALAATTGVEPFRALGKTSERAVPAGEYAYLDGAGRVICRLECKQAAHSAVSGETHNVAFIVQGNTQTPIAAIDEALSAIESHIRRFLGNPASARRAILPQTPTRMAVPAVGEVIA